MTEKEQIIDETIQSLGSLLKPGETLMVCALAHDPGTVIMWVENSRTRETVGYAGGGVGLLASRNGRDG